MCIAQGTHDELRLRSPARGFPMRLTVRALAGPMLLALVVAGCAEQTAPKKLSLHDPSRPNYLPVNFDIPGYTFVCRVGPSNSDAATLDYTINVTPANGFANW